MARLPDVAVKLPDGSVRVRRNVPGGVPYHAESAWTTRDEASERAAELRALGHRAQIMRDPRPFRAIPGAKAGVRRRRPEERDMWTVFVTDEVIPCRN